MDGGGATAGTIAGLERMLVRLRPLVRKTAKAMVEWIGHAL